MADWFKSLKLVEIVSCVVIKRLKPILLTCSYKTDVPLWRVPPWNEASPEGLVHAWLCDVQLTLGLRSHGSPLSSRVTFCR